MNKLQLSIGSILYKELTLHEADYSGHSAFNFIIANCGILLRYKNQLKYELLKDEDNLLVMGITVASKVKYITVNNSIGAVIFKCKDINDIEELAESLNIRVNIKTTNRTGQWKNLLEIIYYKTIRQEKNKWKHIEVDSYEVYYVGYNVKIYSGKDSNNNILIGFNIETGYNCFTDEIEDNNKLYIFRKHIDNSIKTISKCNLNIRNSLYTIDMYDDVMSAIKLFARLSNKYHSFNSKRLCYFKMDKYLILSDASMGIYQILFNKKNLSKITLVDNKNNILKLDSIIPKMQVMGISSTDKNFYENIMIFTYIPSYVAIADDETSYDYMIEVVM